MVGKPLPFTKEREKNWERGKGALCFVAVLTDRGGGGDLVKLYRHQSKMSSSKKFDRKGTLRQVFIRVYRLDIHSVILVLSLWFNTLVLLETKFCRSLTLCIWPVSEPTKFLDHPKQKPRRGGGLRQIQTCRKVPIEVNFFIWRLFALVSVHCTVN